MSLPDCILGRTIPHQVQSSEAGSNKPCDDLCCKSRKAKSVYNETNKVEHCLPRTCQEL